MSGNARPTPIIVGWALPTDNKIDVIKKAPSISRRGFLDVHDLKMMLNLFYLDSQRYQDFH
jgi:hypothetical protein